MSHPNCVVSTVQTLLITLASFEGELFFCNQLYSPEIYTDLHLHVKEIKRLLHCAEEEEDRR